MLIQCEAALAAGMLHPERPAFCHRREYFRHLSSTARPLMTATYLCPPGLILCPASPSKNYFMALGSQHWLFSVLLPYWSPDALSVVLLSQETLHTFHSITAAWHSHSSCREKTSKHPIAYTQLTTKSCFTFESKSITRFDQRSRGHHCLILPFSQSSVCSAFCFSKNTRLPAVTCFGCVAPDTQKLTADCLKKSIFPKLW